MKKALKIILIILGVFIACCLLVFVGANIGKRVMYGEYYDVSVELVPNEGLGDGYTPEDLTAYYIDDDNIIYFSCGEVNSTSPSRIYIIQNGQEKKYFEFSMDGNYIYDAFEGITTIGDYLLISGEYKLYVIDIAKLFDIEEESTTFLKRSINSTIEIDYLYNIDIAGDFLFAYTNNTSTLEDDYILIGQTDSNEGYSYVNVYNASSILTGETLDFSYRIQVKSGAEGIAVGDNRIMLVIPNGILQSSSYEIYEIPSVFDDDNLVILDDRYLVDTIEGPSLAAGLDYIDNNFITLFQSASNKYIYGKFLFMNKIIGINISEV